MSSPFQPGSGDVAAMYDRMTDVFVEALGGSIHVGYWDPHEAAPMETAAARLTTMVGERLGVLPDDGLLDIGCGTGGPALQIARATAARVTGITVSAHQRDLAVTAAQKAGLADRVEFRIADAARLPFDDGSFAGAWAIESLLHMPDRLAVLREAARVVRPGGPLVIADVCLREPPPAGAAEDTLAATAQLFQVADFTPMSRFERDLALSGWILDALSDISENVRATYGHLAAFLRAAADSPGAEGRRLAAGADVLDAFGALPAVGYALVTARRA